MVLVVNKPSSLPVHPCGSYRFNTLLGHLKYIYNKNDELKNIHRLDKVTSGIVIMVKSSEIVREIQSQLCFDNLINEDYLVQLIKNKKYKKEYLAKVNGNF